MPSRGVRTATVRPVTALMLRSAVASDPGPVRADNEDSAFASPRLVAVADGVGGAAAGEVASAAVIDQLILMDKCRLEACLEVALERAVASGNASVGFIADCRPAMAGMSTTLTAVALGEDRYAIANLGDSRAYLVRDGELTQLTRDDSYVQELLESGAIDRAQARRHPQRSVVLAALDGDPARTPAIAHKPARIGDRLLLCSDGLSDFVDDDAIASALEIRSRPRCARRLVELALAAGGTDNVSVVVADVVARDTEASGWLLKGGGT
jgi:serine/threonine protein phosphatase PrpC